MSISKTFFILFTSLLLFACNRANNRKGKTGEGIVTYSITYSDSSKYGLKASLLPKNITLFFKGKKATFVASAGLGTIQIVDLMDSETGTFTSLFIDELHGNYGCKRTQEEIASNESATVFDFHPSEEIKTISGIECRRALAKDVNNKKSFDVYYCDGLNFYYINSPFVKQPHLMLEYTHTINNLTMNLKAVKVDFNSPVDTSMFQIKGSYKWLNEKEYYAHLNSL